MVLTNNLQTKVAQGGVCKVSRTNHEPRLDHCWREANEEIITGLTPDPQAFGIRLVTNPAVVQLARNGGFDAIFIDLEHSTLSIDDASQHCTAALQTGLTPFVRVPHQCGNGFVQRVLDGGAMGVVFPHVHNPGMCPLE